MAEVLHRVGHFDRVRRSGASRGDDAVRASPVSMPSRQVLVGTWVALAVALGSLLAVARATEGPLDDPDPAYQRPGLLDLGALPEPAPPLASTLPTPGRRAVVFFVRPAQLPDVCTAIADEGLTALADLVVVTAGEGETCRALATVISDPERDVAEAYEMPVPRDGGPPVGYVVVDGERRIRYRTLDPEVDDLLGEVKTILDATP